MKKILVLLTMVIILSGCLGGERYNFSGKGSSWKGTYTVDVQNQNRQQISGNLTYTGQDIAPKKVNYIVKSGIEETTGVDIPVEKNVVTIGKSQCNNCSVVNKNQEIKIEISWNGEVEELILKKE